MSLNNNKCLTLLELIVSIAIIGIIVLALATLDFYSRYQVLTSSRLIRLQNEVTLALEHMTRQIKRAIGNERVYGANTVVDITTNPNDVLIRVYVDGSRDGRRDAPINNPPAGVDHWIAYRWDATGAPSNRNEVRYCGRCRQINNCNFNQCLDPVNGEVISNNVTRFVLTVNRNLDGTLRDNFLNVSITACWEPTAGNCGSVRNPSVDMQTRIDLPSVATNGN